MKVLINKKFLDELSKLPNKPRSQIERLAFQEIKNFKILKEIPHIKKLKGYQYYYRLRFGNYRVGLSFYNNILTFERVLHRKDIYKFFP